MKKYILLFVTIFLFALQSCQKEFDPGGTAVQKMAGDWWVTVDIIDVDGTYYPDGYGVGHFKMFTYNTAANLPTELWVDDQGNFWDYKLKVSVNYDKLEFSTTDWVQNESYDSKVKITEGKILLGAAKTPSGMPADSIYYKIQFDDDGADGQLIQVVSGFRRTGFPADDF